ncbi:hypothetical protein ACTMSW_28595 [Micromonospora sp. BQ11]|uniref:hypothetical protein n=1 Tax=Micromonospora sp. BQ11 TaxID=3452212 RepID=UPI003F8C30E6
MASKDSRRVAQPTVSSAPWQRDLPIVAVLLGLLGLSAAATLTAPGSARACAPTPPSAGTSASPPRTPSADCATASPAPSTGGPEPTPWPRIALDPGQPLVAADPRRLSGSRMTMTDLRLEGVVDLPTADGPLTVFKFTVQRAVVDDFRLDASSPAGPTRRSPAPAGRLTVQDGAAFYATRLVGRLLDIEITLRPDLPVPDPLGARRYASATLTEPAIDVAFIKGGVVRTGATLDRAGATAIPPRRRGGG